uniref:GJ17675 gene product from transcript GJ17675-RA n=1 Tax=Apis cerana TaxID=7461 RepID=V9IH36_APICE
MSRKNGYVCPCCRLSCAKPNVLQKHIRVHTNRKTVPLVCLVNSHSRLRIFTSIADLALTSSKGKVMLARYVNSD